jgi:hypothetical protein
VVPRRHLWGCCGRPLSRGWILDKPTGTIRLYYGGADTCLALATAQLSDVLGYLRTCRAPRTRKRAEMALQDEKYVLRRRALNG